MDLTNRFVIIVLSLLLIFAVAVVILLTWSAGPETVEQLDDFVGYLNDHVEEDGFKVIVTLGGLVIALLALLVVFLELAPPKTSTVPVQDVQAGNAVLATNAVARRVQEEVARVPQVAQSKATVAARRKGVEVYLELQVAPDTNLATTSEAASRVVQEVVTGQLGIQMAKPTQIKLHFTEEAAPIEATAPRAPAEGPPPVEPTTPLASSEGPPSIEPMAPSASGEGQSPASTSNEPASRPDEPLLPPEAAPPWGKPTGESTTDPPQIT